MTRGLLLLDANVLIDYQASDLSILTLISQHLGTLHIASTVLEEVDGLDTSDCESLGLQVVEPTLPQLIEAASEQGRLSFEDRTCLVMSRDNDWICVTNDRALRTACAELDVEVRWGLQIMVMLVQGNHLSTHDALHVARMMCEANPAFLGSEMFERVRRRVLGG